MTKHKPLLIIFSGPNGSGKGTVTDAVRRYGEGFPSLCMNHDDIAREHNIGICEATLEATAERAASNARGALQKINRERYCSVQYKLLLYISCFPVQE